MWHQGGEMTCTPTAPKLGQIDYKAFHSVVCVLNPCLIELARLVVQVYEGAKAPATAPIDEAALDAAMRHWEDEGYIHFDSQRLGECIAAYEAARATQPDRDAALLDECRKSFKTFVQDTWGIPLPMNFDRLNHWTWDGWWNLWQAAWNARPAQPITAISERAKQIAIKACDDYPRGSEGWIDMFLEAYEAARVARADQASGLVEAIESLPCYVASNGETTYECRVDMPCAACELRRLFAEQPEANGRSVTSIFNAGPVGGFARLADEDFKNSKHYTGDASAPSSKGDGIDTSACAPSPASLQRPPTEGSIIPYCATCKCAHVEGYRGCTARLDYGQQREISAVDWAHVRKQIQDFLINNEDEWGSKSRAMLAGVSKILGEATPEPASLKDCVMALAKVRINSPYICDFPEDAKAVLDAAGVSYVD
jgi:hypothetical protein